VLQGVGLAGTPLVAPSIIACVEVSELLGEL
jgi:hypothetical protein